MGSAWLVIWSGNIRCGKISEFFKKNPKGKKYLAGNEGVLGN